MSNKYSSSEILKEKLLEGVNRLTDIVSTTLGPKGHNVIIKKANKINPVVTKDGVTVASSITFDDEFVDLGAQVVKQVTSKTNSEAGDGTTTSTVLTQAMLQNGFCLIDNRVSVSHVKAGMQLAAKDAVSVIKSLSRHMTSLDEIRHVAHVSSNGDEEITNIICEAVSSIGKGGSITIEEARSNSTSLSLLEGFSFDSGYAAGAFVTDERLALCKYENPLFLLTDERIGAVEQILPALEIAARESRPFIIIADDIEGQALAALIMNCIRGSMKVAAVKAPCYGEERRQLMYDLSVAIGAKYFNSNAGHGLAGADLSLEDFGSAKSIVIKKAHTTIVGGHGNPEIITARLHRIESEIDQETDDSELRVLLERKNRLVSGIGVINVGAPTELEMIEKKHRIEDALEAVRSAQEEGYVPGGGLALHIASQSIDPKQDLTEGHKIGYEIVRSSLTAPTKKLCHNSCVDYEEVTSAFEFDIEKSKFVGFDFAREHHVDMVEGGIIDPAKVTRCALENAVSVASTLLCTSVAIVEE